MHILCFGLRVNVLLIYTVVYGKLFFLYSYLLTEQKRSFRLVYILL